MKNYCIDCTHLNKNKCKENDCYYCEKKGDYVHSNQTGCDKFENRDQNSPQFYFVVLVIVVLLGLLLNIF